MFFKRNENDIKKNEKEARAAAADIKKKGFTLSKASTEEHARKGARFQIARREAQPIGLADLEEFSRESKERKQVEILSVIGNAFIVFSFILSWYQKRSIRKRKELEERKRREKEEESKNRVEIE